MVKTGVFRINALSRYNGLFQLLHYGTVGATSGQLLRKVELAKMQDRLMDGSESWDS